jgi:hypothetical protein
MVCRMRGRVGWVCEEDECSGLGKLLGERVVEYQSVHSSLSRRYGVCAHRHLVRFAFAVPLYRNETLCFKLILRGGELVLVDFGVGASSELLETGLEMNGLVVIYHCRLCATT